MIIKYDAAVQVSIQTGGLAEGGTYFNRFNLFIYLFIIYLFLIQAKSAKLSDVWSDFDTELIIPLKFLILLHAV